MNHLLFVLAALTVTAAQAAPLTAQEQAALADLQGHYSKTGGCARLPSRLLLGVEGQALTIRMNASDRVTATRGTNIEQWSDDIDLSTVNDAADVYYTRDALSRRLKVTEQTRLRTNGQRTEVIESSKREVLFSPAYYVVTSLQKAGTALQYSRHEGESSTSDCVGTYSKQ